jgi:putative nucleotidyltransferase with HDIG domain
VISMGDVFTLVTLVHFGAAPALVTYWIDILAAHTVDQARRHGVTFIHKASLYKFLFNLASCSLSVLAMSTAADLIGNLNIPYPGDLALKLLAASFAWFWVNTSTVAVAIGLFAERAIIPVWKDGIGICVTNFAGSAAAAGLMSLFYRQVGFYIFVLCLPLAVIIYQLHRFYIEKYQEAEARISDLNKLYLQTIEALASAVDAKDRYTHGHIRRVEAYAVALAKCLGVTDDQELTAIQAGALLHDIGKIAIPEYILNKPTVLTETEFEKMKMHPVVGAQMLSRIEFPYPVVPMVKYHHERWDGKGYPEGLKGTDIPLGARILSLVDCYDALTTNRPYRSPMPRPQIVEFFHKESGTAYDPMVVETLIHNLETLELASSAVKIDEVDLWGMRDMESEPKANVRVLEKVQPTLTYGKALNASPDVQRELYSVFEFARA